MNLTMTNSQLDEFTDDNFAAVNLLDTEQHVKGEPLDNG